MTLPVFTTVGRTAAWDHLLLRARALHATLPVADLHADSLLWGRDLCGGAIAGTSTSRAWWIARSIAYAVERIGVEHVGLGSDWDGAVRVPFDAAGLVHLTDALMEVGLDEAEIRAVTGENVLRVLGAALP